MRNLMKYVSGLSAMGKKEVRGTLAVVSWPLGQALIPPDFTGPYPGYVGLFMCFPKAELWLPHAVEQEKPGARSKK